jgi:flagellar biosynthetic protein FliQ
MNESIVIDLTRQATIVGFMLTLPLLAMVLFVGLAVSLFQALTQIQEMTLTYLPKLVGAAIILIVLGGWMLTTIVGFTQTCFEYAAKVGV